MAAGDQLVLQLGDARAEGKIQLHRCRRLQGDGQVLAVQDQPEAQWMVPLKYVAGAMGEGRPGYPGTL